MTQMKTPPPKKGFSGKPRQQAQGNRANARPGNPAARALADAPVPPENVRSLIAHGTFEQWMQKYARWYVGARAEGIESLKSK